MLTKLIHETKGPICITTQQASSWRQIINFINPNINTLIINPKENVNCTSLGDCKYCTREITDAGLRVNNLKNTIIPEETEKENQVAINNRKDLFPNNVPYYSVSFTSSAVYSVTSTSVNAILLKEVLKQVLIDKPLISSIIFFDCTSNVGGDCINSIYNWQLMKNKIKFKILACEIDTLNFACLQDNIAKFGYNDFIKPIKGDCVKVLDDILVKKYPSGWISPNIVYFDPPWGGRSYKKEVEVILELSGINIWDLVIKTFDIETVLFVLVKAPYNVDKSGNWKLLKPLVTEIKIGNVVFFLFRKDEKNKLVANILGSTSSSFNINEKKQGFEDGLNENLVNIEELKYEISNTIGELTENLVNIKNDGWVQIKYVPMTLPTIMIGKLADIKRHFIRFYLIPKNKDVIKYLLNVGWSSLLEWKLSWNKNNELLILDLYYTVKEEFEKVLSSFVTSFRIYSVEKTLDNLQSVQLDGNNISVFTYNPWSVTSTVSLIQSPKMLISEYFTGNSTMLWPKQAEHL